MSEEALNGINTLVNNGVAIVTLGVLLFHFIPKVLNKVIDAMEKNTKVLERVLELLRKFDSEEKE